MTEIHCFPIIPRLGLMPVGGRVSCCSALLVISLPAGLSISEKVKRFVREGCFCGDIEIRNFAWGAMGSRPLTCGARCGVAFCSPQSPGYSADSVCSRTLNSTSLVNSSRGILLHRPVGSGERHFVPAVFWFLGRFRSRECAYLRSYVRLMHIGNVAE